MHTIDTDPKSDGFNDYLASVALASVATDIAGTSAGGRVLKRWQKTISPAEPLTGRHPLGEAKPADVWLRVFDAGGREVIAHRHGHWTRRYV